MLTNDEDMDGDEEAGWDETNEPYLPELDEERIRETLDRINSRPSIPSEEASVFAAALRAERTRTGTLRAALAALVALIEDRHVEPDDDAFVAASVLIEEPAP